MERDQIITKIEWLQKNSIITNSVGDFKKPLTFSAVLWAKRPPGVGFNIYKEINSLLSKNKLTILVDDLLPKSLNHRTTKEQCLVNDSYKEFFDKDCYLIFSSEVYNAQEPVEYLLDLIKISTRLSYHNFKRSLPEKKNAFIETLTMAEILHCVNELALIDYASNHANTLLIGQFAFAMLSLHRNISLNPLNAIVVSKFGSQEEISNIINLIKHEKNT